MTERTLPKDICPKCGEYMGPVHTCSQIRRDSEIAPAPTPGSDQWRCRIEELMARIATLEAKLKEKQNEQKRGPLLKYF